MRLLGKTDERDVAVIAGGRRWTSSMVVSVAVHAAVVTVLCWPVTPVVIIPRLVAHGEGGNAMAGPTVALYLPAELRVPEARAESAPQIVAPRLRAEKVKASPVKQRNNALEVEHPSGSRQVGSPGGTSYAGLSYGDEVKPALPSVFPDLTLHRDELPTGVQGDVIVEVTIDASGMVAETRLLQGLGHGIDERVIAVLHEWRFRPATRNGVPIPSKHDVHFHFPS
jgi:protein TonB